MTDAAGSVNDRKLPVRAEPNQISDFGSVSSFVIRHSSLSSTFDLAVLSKSGLGDGPIVQDVSQPVEQAEPDGRGGGADEAQDEPLPEREPADERPGAGVDEDEQAEHQIGK